MPGCVSHEIRRIKRITLPRRRCWTEIVRKIDGFDIQKIQKKPQTKEEPTGPVVSYSCGYAQVFLATEIPKFLQVGQPEVVV
jgi:hypothetical protein